MQNKKTKLREELLRQRKALTVEQTTELSKKIFNQFTKNETTILAENYLNIALYFPIRGEVDTKSFFKYFDTKSKVCLFPKLIEKKESPNSKELEAFSNLKKSQLIMRFYPIKNFSDLVPATYGIPEPVIGEKSEPIIPDVLFVPAIAFSKEGHRLGFGGGFYDRLIGEWNELLKKKKITIPRLIGLAYEFQIIDSIAAEPTDLKVDFILTEKRLLKIE